MDKVTNKMLDNMVGFINADLAVSEKKKIKLDYAYGGVQLVIVHYDQGQSESDISRRLTKREMYETLYTIQNLLRIFEYHPDWLALKKEK